MATTILKPKIEAVGFIDLIAIGALKQIEEGLTTPIIGNGTLISGGIKGIAAGIIDGKGGKIGKYISGAFAVDAGEDLAISLMSMVGIGPGGAGLPGIGGGMGGGGEAAW